MGHQRTCEQGGWRKTEIDIHTERGGKVDEEKRGHDQDEDDKEHEGAQREQTQMREADERI